LSPTDFWNFPGGSSLSTFSAFFFAYDIFWHKYLSIDGSFLHQTQRNLEFSGHLFSLGLLDSHFRSINRRLFYNGVSC
jgi:hypothetical protein